MKVFMAKRQSTSDGFIPRRMGSRLGDLHTSNDRRSSHKTFASRHMQHDEAYDGGLRREPFDTQQDVDDFSKKRRHNKDPHGRHRRPLRTIKRFVIFVFMVFIVLGGYLGYRTFLAGSNIFQGNILDVFFQSQPLKQDGNGRSNILIIGTSDDDPGHQGANLTDSMMILSVDQKNKNAYMISVPRDLWVQYGKSCASGDSGKINVYYSCSGGEGGDVTKDRAALTDTAHFVGGIFGIDIQYGVNVDYTVMRDLVNAVGGITVTIQSRDPRGVMDSNFDWKCGVGDPKVTRAEVLQRCPPNGHFIDLPNGPVNLDAEHALYLAQARGDIAPTYGLEQSNFDREKNQQLIIKALREKMVSVGVVTDFGKMNVIISSLGTNLRTTFNTGEVKTIISLTKTIQDTDIHSVSLIDGSNPVMTTEEVDGQSVVVPSAGLDDYSALRLLMKQTFSRDPVIKEKANIAVFNASGVAGIAQKQASLLSNDGLVVDEIDTAPTGTYSDVELFQIGTGMNATRSRLESRFGVKTETSSPPVEPSDGTNFILIIGKDTSVK